MKIYTKTGDEGKTSLLGGKRVDKFDAKIEAYGTVDELNSFVGVLVDGLDQNLFKNEYNDLLGIQSLLFNIGSELAKDPEFDMKLVTVDEDDIQFLEREMDEMDAVLPKLSNFILPGGHPSSSAAHVCRTICRRAERRVLILMNDNNILIIKYLNRLSDYFFVLSRFVLLKHENSEVKWTSEKNS